MPSLTVSCYTVFSGYFWKACSFMKGNRGGGRRGGGGVDGMGGGDGNREEWRRKTTVEMY